jgi:hypothetical protein
MTAVSADKGKMLPQDVDFAIALICSLTGEEPDKLHKLHHEQILTYLSYLLKCEKQKVINLLRNHNQNQNLDFISLAKLWRLVSKGIINQKPRRTGVQQEAVQTNIEFQMATRSHNAMLSPPTSNSYSTSASAVQTESEPAKVDIKALRPLMVKMSIAPSHIAYVKSA